MHQKEHADILYDVMAKKKVRAIVGIQHVYVWGVYVHVYTVLSCYFCAIKRFKMDRLNAADPGLYVNDVVCISWRLPHQDDHRQPAVVADQLPVHMWGQDPQPPAAAPVFDPSSAPLPGPGVAVVVAPLPGPRQSVCGS